MSKTEDTCIYLQYEVAYHLDARLNYSFKAAIRVIKIPGRPKTKPFDSGTSIISVACLRLGRPLGAPKFEQAPALFFLVDGSLHVLEGLLVLDIFNSLPISGRNFLIAFYGTLK